MFEQNEQTTKKNHEKLPSMQKANVYEYLELINTTKLHNRNKSHLLFSSAEMFKKLLWQPVWTKIRLLL